MNFVTAVTSRPEMNVDLILPASAFRRMIVTIDRLTSIANPIMQIISGSDKIPMFFRQIKLSEKQCRSLGLDTNVILQNIYAQDDVS